MNSRLVAPTPSDLRSSTLGPPRSPQHNPAGTAMARILAGGCRVWALQEGRPRRLGRLKIWNRAGRRSGARAISLRVMELEVGLSPGIRTAKADDVLYVFKGQGTF